MPTVNLTATTHATLGGDTNLEREVIHYFQALDEVKRQQDALAKRRKTLNTEVSALMMGLGTRELRSNVGVILLKSGRSVTVDKDKLKTRLVEKGVSVDTVVGAFAHATREREYTTVEYRPVKGI